MLIITHSFINQIIGTRAKGTNILNNMTKFIKIILFILLGLLLLFFLFYISLPFINYLAANKYLPHSFCLRCDSIDDDIARCTNELTQLRVEYEQVSNKLTELRQASGISSHARSQSTSVRTELRDIILKIGELENRISNLEDLKEQFAREDFKNTKNIFEPEEGEKGRGEKRTAEDMEEEDKNEN